MGINEDAAEVFKVTAVVPLPGETSRCQIVDVRLRARDELDAVRRTVLQLATSYGTVLEILGVRRRMDEEGRLLEAPEEPKKPEGPTVKPYPARALKLIR